MIKEDVEIFVDDLRKVMEDLNILTKQDLLSNNETWKTIPGYEQFLLNLSNCQIQDILEELGMLENGNCLYTAEEIFKAGIEYAINKGFKNYNTLKECIAWFEKQGERKHTNSKDDERLKKTTIAFLKDFAKQGYENAVECIDWLEKQGEQKSVDKIELNFNVGDWIITKNGNIAQILDKQQHAFVGLDINGNDFVCNYGHTSSMKHWTIQDAKDGDLIYVSTKIKGIQAIFHKFENGIIYFHCNLCGDFAQGGYELYSDVKFVNPLPKIHYQKFFQKMKEAGYEWDAEKKELKKIEHKFKVGDIIKYVGEREEFSKEKHTIKKILDDCYLTIDDMYIPFKFEEYYILINQNQSWSEEDEMMLECVLDKISDLGTGEMCKDWLKSLKPRWKPTKEQMKALKYVVDYFGELTKHFAEYDEIKSLYNDLKNL